MTSRTPQQILAVTLALCFFFASSLLTATTAKHATHSGHDQTSHHQTWCGWLCAAGQAIQTPSLEPAQAFALTAKINLLLQKHASFLLSIHPQSRAPPIILS